MPWSISPLVLWSPILWSFHPLAFGPLVLFRHSVDPGFSQVQASPPEGEASQSKSSKVYFYAPIAFVKEQEGDIVPTQGVSLENKLQAAAEEGDHRRKAQIAMQGQTSRDASCTPQRPVAHLFFHENGFILPCASVWTIVRKLRNKLMHALHGNHGRPSDVVVSTASAGSRLLSFHCHPEYWWIAGGSLETPYFRARL